MAKSPEEMADSMVENLKEKTGKALGEWIHLLDIMKDSKHGELVKHLKQNHGITMAMPILSHINF